MSEEKAAGIKGTLAGWIKAGITSIVGLMSGAVLMYLTPLINNTIKPPKPLANFATQVKGLTVTFDNHSTGGVQGWWDFGDGSALVPFAPKDAVTTHTYTKPGTYNVKLALQSLLGDESERAVALNVDGSTAAAPVIEEFKVEPSSPGQQRAPATFRLTSKVKNAAYCILAHGDDRPLQIDVDATSQARFVSFEKPGTYTLRLAALSGKDVVEKTETITIGAGDPAEPMARLHVSYEAVEVKRYEKPFRIQCVWNRDPKESVSPFREVRPITPGYLITAVELVNKDDRNAPVRNLKLEVAPDKMRFILTGELVRSKSPLATQAAPAWQAEIKVAMERRSAPVVVDSGRVTIAVHLNGTVKLPMQPLPAGYEVVKQRVHMELWDGTRKAWEGNQMVKGAPVTLKNQPCLVTLTPQIDGVMLKVDVSSGPAAVVPAVVPATGAVPSVVRPASFDRLPYLPKSR